MPPMQTNRGPTGPAPGTPQTSQSLLFQKLGNRLKKGIEDHRADKDDFGDMRLPPGIDNGIAELVECKFMEIPKGKQNEGKVMFHAAGIVKSPVEHDGVKVEGLRTFINELIDDTPTQPRQTVEDHIGYVMNILSILGVKREGITPENMERVAEGLKKLKPHFRFRTWALPKLQPVEKGGQWFFGKKGPYVSLEALKKANPNWDRPPIVNHTWGGAVQWSGRTEPGSAMSAAPSGNGHAPATTAHREGPEEEVITEEDSAHTEAPAPEYTDGGDLASLGEAADGGDKEAAKSLKEQAAKMGFTEEEINGTNTWADLATLMMAGGSGGGETESEEAEGPGEGGQEEEEEEEATSPPPPPPPPAAAKAFVPEKGKACRYFPTDKATNKPGKTPVQAEVMLVDTKAKTATVKNLESGKVVKGVPWANLKSV